MATKCYVTLDEKILPVENSNEYYIAWDYASDVTAADKNKTKEFQIQWQFTATTPGGTWFEGQTNTVPVGQQRNNRYSPPENATYIRVRIKAVPNDNQTYSAGTSVYSDFIRLSLIPAANTDRVCYIDPYDRIRLENNTENDYYITWSYSSAATSADRNATKEFQVVWNYTPTTVNGQWFPGTEETVSVDSIFISTYSPPENAAHIRVRIKPIHNEYSEYSKGESFFTDWINLSLATDANSGSAESYTSPESSIRLEEGTTSNYYIRWTFRYKSEVHKAQFQNTENYTVHWQYETEAGSGTWFLGSLDNVELPERVDHTSTHFFNAPDNAERIRVRIRANPKTYTSLGKERAYYNTTYCNWIVFNIKRFGIPQTPAAPTAYVSKDYLYYSATSDDDTVHSLQFEVYIMRLNGIGGVNKTPLDDGGRSTLIHKVQTVFRAAGGSLSILGIGGRGREYRVRCRALKQDKNGKLTIRSDWSEFSDAAVTAPAKLKIMSLRALAEDEVQIFFRYEQNLGPDGNPLPDGQKNVNESAEKYILEWATSEGYFDTGSVDSDEIDATQGKWDIEKNGLETGTRWYFRIRAVANDLYSEWSNIESIVLGTRPDPPTTWSELSTISIDSSLMPDLSTVDELDPSSMITTATSDDMDLNLNTSTNVETAQPGETIRIVKQKSEQTHLPLTQLYVPNIFSTGDTIYFRLDARCGYNPEGNIRLVARAYNSNIVNNREQGSQVADNGIVINPTTGSEYTTIIGTITLTNANWTDATYYRITVTDARSSKSAIYVKNVTIYRCVPTILNRLYWAHNSEDGSSQTAGQIQFTRSAFGNYSETSWIESFSSSNQSSTGLTQGRTYRITPNGNLYLMFPPSTVESYDYELKWKVRTKGILDTIWVDGVEQEAFSGWSTERSIKVRAKPTITLSVPELCEKFPFDISFTPGPRSRTLIGYTVVISLVSKILPGQNPVYVSSNVIYEDGMAYNYKRGDVVYQKYFTPDSPVTGGSTVTVRLLPNDLYLLNQWTYRVTITGVFDSGLSEKGTADFTVLWNDDLMGAYIPTTIGSAVVNDDYYYVDINPMCVDRDNNFPNSSMARLAVYRRENNGSFIKIATDLPNQRTLHVIDPHPSLDYANYRIVSTNLNTGQHAFLDLPSIPILADCVTMQWDEDWVPYYVAADDEDQIDSQLDILNKGTNTSGGSFLKIRWNIDVADNFTPETSLINYIGREYPVSYYGTQKGSTSTWNVSIPAEDTETLFAIRRLANWMGDVYVREPSGSSYWANVTVSYNINHSSVTIPVTFNIKRVDGEYVGSTTTS